MSNSEDGAVLKLSPNSGLDEIICLQVDSSSGFIQDEDPGLPQESSSQTHQLPLAHTGHTTIHDTFRTQHCREPLAHLLTTNICPITGLLHFVSSEPTWGSLLPLHTPAPVLPAGCWQTSEGENVPELSTPLHHCTSQRGPGSSSVCLRKAQAPVAERRLWV